MKNPKNYLLAFLAVTTVGGALLAWRQYQELVELRAQAMNPSERADLQKRVWDLEKSNRDLRERAVAAAGPRTEGEPAAADPSGDGRGRGRSGRVPDGGPMTAMRELVNRPEVQAFLAAQQKARIQQEYAALFRKLNLPPAQAAKVQSLLAERQTTALDVMEAARSQGIDPRQNPEAFRKLLGDARAEVESSLKSVLGDSGYSQLQGYEQTMPQRNLVNELQLRLSQTDTPLSLAQADQLVQVLAANAPARTAAAAQPVPPMPGPPPDGGRGGRGPDLGGMVAAFVGGGPLAFPIPAAGPGAGPGGGIISALGGGAVNAAPITSQAVAQSQAILSQPQVTALQQMQQQQQAAQQVQQLVRETLQSSAPGRAPGGEGAPPAPGRRPGG